jgi:hypothetical protein
MRQGSQDSSTSFGMTKWERLKDDKVGAFEGMTKWERLKE